MVLTHGNPLNGGAVHANIHVAGTNTSNCTHASPSLPLARERSPRGSVEVDLWRSIVNTARIKVGMNMNVCIHRSKWMDPEAGAWTMDEKDGCWRGLGACIHAEEGGWNGERVVASWKLGCSLKREQSPRWKPPTVTGSDSIYIMEKARDNVCTTLLPRPCCLPNLSTRHRGSKEPVNGFIWIRSSPYPPSFHLPSFYSRSIFARLLGV